MKKIKKWLVLAGLMFGAILMILLNKWDSTGGIKNRMKRREIKMGDLKKREAEIKKIIENTDGESLELSGELIYIRKKKSELKEIVKEEIKHTSDNEKAKLLAKLLKDL